MNWLRGRDWPELALLALGAVLVLALIALVVVAFVSPSCEERGGEEVFSHFQPIIHSSGKTMWIQNVPIYDCLGAK